jgi:hypothetical protein
MSIKGSFCDYIKAKHDKIYPCVCKAMVEKNLMNFKLKKYLNSCEVLVKDANPNASHEYLKTISWVKPYFDFDETLNYKPSDAEIVEWMLARQEEVLTSIRCVSPKLYFLNTSTWRRCESVPHCCPVGMGFNPPCLHMLQRNPVVLVINMHVNVCRSVLSSPDAPLAVLAANRHRAIDNNKFKLSGRFYVQGYKTTLTDMHDLAKKHRAKNPTSSMDISVYSNARKMNMVFCAKGDKGADTKPLLPGFLPADHTTLMYAQDGSPNPLFDPMAYCIQYVMPTDTTLSVAMHRLDAYFPSSSTTTGAKRRLNMDLHVDDEGSGVKRVCGFFDKVKPVLERAGFVNPRQTGQPSEKTGTTCVDFDCDNRSDCPLCHKEHTNNMWYVVVGKTFVISNHSTTCRPDKVKHELSYIRPKSPLMRAICAFEAGRHADYAMAFVDAYKDILKYEGTHQLLMKHVDNKWRQVTDGTLMSAIFDFVSDTMELEEKNLDEVLECMPPLNCRETTDKLLKQKKLIKAALALIGKTDFQRSVLAQVCVCV